jgi:hypothetical protein
MVFLVRNGGHLMQDPEIIPNPNTNTLLSRLQAGDEQALSDLADEFGTKIYQLAFRYLRNKKTRRK